MATSNLSFEFYRSALLEQLEGSPIAADYDLRGRNFSILVDLFAKATYYIGAHTTFLKYEMSPYTARTKSSLFLHAMFKGVVPVVSKCASAGVIVKTQQLMDGDQFTCSVTNQTVYATNTKLIDKVDTTLIYSSILCAGSYKRYEFNLTSSDKYIIPSSTCDATTIKITDSSGRVLYTNLLVSPTDYISREFDAIVVKNTNYYEVLINSSRRSSIGSSIVVEYVESSGESGNSINTKNLVRQVPASTITSTPASFVGGLSSYSIEQIRDQIIFARQRRGVLIQEDDYKALLAQFFPTLSVVSVSNDHPDATYNYGHIAVAIVTKIPGLKPALLSPGLKNTVKHVVSQYTIAGLHVSIVDPVLWEIRAGLQSVLTGIMQPIHQSIKIDKSKFYRQVSAIELGYTCENVTALKALNSTFNFTSATLDQYKVTAPVLSLPGLNQASIVTVTLQSKGLLIVEGDILYTKESPLHDKIKLGTIDKPGNRINFNPSNLGHTIAVNIDGINQTLLDTQNTFYYVESI